MLGTVDWGIVGTAVAKGRYVHARTALTWGSDIYILTAARRFYCGGCEEGSWRDIAPSKEVVWSRWR